MNAFTNAAAAVAASILISAPARAQEPSDVAVGLAMVQWSILNCEFDAIPANAIQSFEMLGEYVPDAEMERAFEFVNRRLAANFPNREERCPAALGLIEKSFGPLN